MLNIAVFVSGRGSNLKSLNESAERKIRICAVVSDKENCGAVGSLLKTDSCIFCKSK